MDQADAEHIKEKDTEEEKSVIPYILEVFERVRETREIGC